MFAPVLGRRFPHAPCPGCGLHNDVKLEECAHCQRRFGATDRRIIDEYAAEQKAKGRKMMLFMAIACAVVLVITALA